MTGPDLYREALRLRQEARDHFEFPSEAYAQAMAEAQMLMTGALAAATALTGDRASYTDEPEIRAWHAAAGTKGGEVPDAS
ncbi:hypothetical protein ABT061_15660 [Streptosporangium sp. NPDC002544]|uniref:hypothetical protein n=1 Tax=Streptosporangium sp. NPDC002544 TaxID=3154538 RepID=UPI00333157BB